MDMVDEFAKILDLLTIEAVCSSKVWQKSKLRRKYASMINSCGVPAQALCLPYNQQASQAAPDASRLSAKHLLFWLSDT